MLRARVVDQQLEPRSCDAGTNAARMVDTGLSGNAQSERGSVLFPRCTVVTDKWQWQV